ncbi:MAG: hypothetical protein FWG74_09515, partial [Planctomycetes bacterium]|nr:hypothetical protein [Planctomycetota bacterium]
MNPARPGGGPGVAAGSFLDGNGVPTPDRQAGDDKTNPQDWYGCLGTTAMFLLPMARVGTTGGSWDFPLLSFGEWLLLPLGVLSLTMGLLSHGKLQRKTALPLWIAAAMPAFFWLAAAGLTMFSRGVAPNDGDLFLSWIVRLIFPVMTFLPLLVVPVWRDRLMWALAAGLTINTVSIFWQSRTAGLAPPDMGLLDIGGMLSNQHDYALLLGIAIPLLAAWRGGGIRKNRALAMLFCTFLLPALVLAACYSGVGITALAVGLAVSLAAWRGPAWILGVFLCLLTFGYGSEVRMESETKQRRLITASFQPGGDNYQKALTAFEEKPF